MRRWFEELSYKFQRFMQGRYGRDELSGVSTIVALILLILSLFKSLHFLIYFALVLLIWTLFRAYSKNRAKRAKELETYLKIKKSISNKWKLLRNRWRDRDTHIYVKCPNCKCYIRLSKPPKGKTIMINCPQCKNSFEKKT